MEILLLTTLFSIVFALLFLSLFVRERQTREFGGVERDALMPLDDGDEPVMASRLQPDREAPKKKITSPVPSDRETT